MALGRLAGRIILAHGWRRALIAFAAGLAATLALAPVDLPVAGFLAFPVLVWLLDGASGAPGASLPRRLAPAFRIGWCFGFGYFVGGLWWLGAAMLVDAGAFLWALPLAVLGLPAILAIYHGLACALARLLWSDGPGRLLALAAAFALLEWARGMLFTGFPWNEIGTMATPAPLLMGSVAAVGVHSLTLLAVFTFALPALLGTRARGQGLAFAAGALILAAHVGYGAWRLETVPAGTVAGTTLQIVQPNIVQSEKWDAAEAERIFATHLRLSEPLPDDVAEPGAEPARRLVIWPESAFPFVLTERPDAVARLADALGDTDTLLAGAVRVEGAGADERFYNSVYAINGDGAVEAASDKLHLVPFGEYLPFQSTLEGLGVTQLTALPGGFSAGSARRLIRPAGAGPALLPLICYEIIFPGEIRPDASDPRPAAILNLTNDGWYGRTPGPYQHLRQAQLSAVALGLPMVRAANTGVSVVTDAAGRVVAGLPLGAEGRFAAALPEAAPPTLYARTGDMPFWIAVSAFFLAASAFAMRFTRAD